MEPGDRSVDPGILMDAARPPRFVITGPTAVGKTDLTLDLAERLGTDIISADSRQIYRELTIGTAKPGPEELRRVRHHFVDERSVSEPWSAGRFAEEADAVASELESAGKPVIITGGSTLYLHALLAGLADIPPVPDEIRRELTERMAAQGAEALYARLKSVDPESAATMDATKTQRIIRALEVYEATGTPLSHFHRRPETEGAAYRLIVLNRHREELYGRINRRAEQMIEAGLVEEVRAVLGAGFSPDLTPLRTIGYREVIAHLQGTIDLPETLRLIQRNTRRYAKRQLTWFRRYPHAAWYHLDEIPEGEVVRQLLEEMTGG